MIISPSKVSNDYVVWAHGGDGTKLSTLQVVDKYRHTTKIKIEIIWFPLKSMPVWLTNHNTAQNYRTLFWLVALRLGAFWQFPFRWIYYYSRNKSIRKETGKTHLSVLHLKKKQMLCYDKRWNSCATWSCSFITQNSPIRQGTLAHLKFLPIL